MRRHSDKAAGKTETYGLFDTAVAAKNVEQALTGRGWRVIRDLEAAMRRVIVAEEVRRSLAGAARAGLRMGRRRHERQWAGERGGGVSAD